MLFPTLSTFLVLALLGAPGVLASSDPTVNLNLDNLTPTRVRRTPAPAPDSFELINPTSAPVRELELKPLYARILTNGQRLARGLPPRSPAQNRRRRRPTHPYAPLAPRHSPAPCSEPRGTLHVVDAELGIPLGVVSSQANSFGEYRLGQGMEGAALSVVLRRCSGDAAAGHPFEVETQNGLADFSYFGGIVGFAADDDDVSRETANYIYVGGTTSVPYGPAQAGANSYSAASGTPRDIESAIWTLGGDGALAMDWTNMDGAVAAGAHLVYVPSADAFVLTGNVAKFRARFGPAPEVTFKFMPEAGGAL